MCSIYHFYHMHHYYLKFITTVFTCEFRVKRQHFYAGFFTLVTNIKCENTTQQKEQVNRKVWLSVIGYVHNLCRQSSTSSPLKHIQPVHAGLMQAMWRTLRNPQDKITNIAFRVLGKNRGTTEKCYWNHIQWVVSAL